MIDFELDSSQEGCAEVRPPVCSKALSRLHMMLQGHATCKVSLMTGATLRVMCRVMLSLCTRGAITLSCQLDGPSEPLAVAALVSVVSCQCPVDCTQTP